MTDKEYFVEIELVGKDKKNIETYISDDIGHSIEADLNDIEKQKKLTKCEKTKKYFEKRPYLTKTIIPLVLVSIAIVTIVAISMFFFANQL